MDKTYCEQENREPIDWLRWLERAERGELSLGEHYDYGIRACSWMTCACGNQCAIIPRDIAGAPRDAMLVGLGADFALQVEHEDYGAARSILAAIEARAAVLIRQELAKLQAAL